MKRYGRATVTTAAMTGEGTLSFQVPGTYAVVNPRSPDWVGRTILRWNVKFASSAIGDAITSITIEDTDGVLSAPEQAQFPNYPILAALHDTDLSSSNQGIYLDPTAPSEFSPEPGTGSIASQLYFIIAVKKSTNVADTAYFNVQWDDGE